MAALLALSALWPGSALRAQSPDLTAYTPAEGLPSSRILALLQDQAGYLWFGTTAGLARYDGSSFRVLTRDDGLTGNTIVALAQAGGGLILAAAAEGGVSVIAGDEIYPLVAEQVSTLNVHAMTARADGSVVLAAEEGVLEYRGGALTRLQMPGVTPQSLAAIMVDRRGRVWAGDAVGLIEMDRGQARRVGSVPGVAALVEDAAGSLLVGTEKGLYRRVGERLERVASDVIDGAVLSARRAADGSVWLGTTTGAFRLDRAGRLTMPGGLRGLRVNALLVDHEGSSWFGTDSGALKLVPSIFETLTAADGLPNDYVFAVRTSAGGGVWIGTRAGLVRFDDAGLVKETILAAPLGIPQLQAFDVSDKGTLAVAGGGRIMLRNAQVRAEFERDRGWSEDVRITGLILRSSGLWVGTDAGLYRPSGGAYELVGAGSALAGAAILALSEDAEGRLWVGTRGHGVWLQTDAGFEASATIDPELRLSTIWALAADASDGVWAATNGFGAVRLDAAGGQVRLTRAGNGLASDFVQQVVTAADGSVWLYTNRGLDRWDPAIGITHYDTADGLVSMSANPGAGARDAAGTLWMGTPRGAVVHRSSAQGAPPVAPIVVIEGVLAGGLPARSEELMALSPRRADLTFDFTALSYREEDSTRFQYRLRGHSEEWSRPTSERRVSYLSLPPGDYTFEVQAISGDGLWSEVPAAVAVAVRPELWQMAWVRWLLAGVAALIVALVFQRRLGQVKAERRTLRVMVDKRTRELVEKNTLLERMATTDELTSLPNRRFFLEYMERELRKMTRLSSDQQLSLLVIDLDRFKSVNDRFGHAAGDEVLRQVARRLGQGVRATDLAARYGGEEFAILLPDTGPPGARFLAEKLRAEVEGTQLRFNGTRIKVTISVGVASIAAPARYEPEIEEELLRHADEAMYRAKTEGRNRVVVADQSPE